MVITSITYRILVNDEDVTANLYPYLTSLSITDNDSDAVDELTLELNAKFLRPAHQDKIKVFIEDQFLGLFYVQKTTIRNNQQLSITASSTDFSSNVKARHQANYDDMTLKQVATKIADRNNLAIRSNMNEPASRFEQVNESDMSFLNRLAKEHNAIFNIKNDTLYFMKKHTDVPEVEIDISLCHTVEITYSNKTLYKSCKATYQNTKLNKNVSIIVGEGEPQLTKQGHFQNDDEARIYAENALKRATKSLAEGSLSIAGKVIFAGSNLTLDNDVYSITKVSHNINSSGWVTACNFSNASL